MPAKPSGEIKVSTVRVRQKNGDIYILERKTVYNREKKYNQVLSSKLIGKIPKGEENPVPTRPKAEKRLQKTRQIPKTICREASCWNDGYHRPYWHCFRH